MIEALFVSALLAVPHSAPLADARPRLMMASSVSMAFSSSGERQPSSSGPQSVRPHTLSCKNSSEANSSAEISIATPEYIPAVGSLGRLGNPFEVPVGMMQEPDVGPSQREERAVHGLLAANAFFSVGSRLFTQRCLGEQTCHERNKLTRELYTNRPKTGIMVQAASTAIENYLLWRIHDNADKRPWVRAAIVGVLAFNVWNFANDLRVYKQTGRNK